jgi:hypothetical protein
VGSRHAGFIVDQRRRRDRRFRWLGRSRRCSRRRGTHGVRWWCSLRAINRGSAQGRGILAAGIRRSWTHGVRWWCSLRAISRGAAHGRSILAAGLRRRTHWRGRPLNRLGDVTLRRGVSSMRRGHLGPLDAFRNVWRLCRL